MSHACLLALAIPALGQRAFAGSAERNVFAHYMVCIPTYGGASKIEDYQREIRDKATWVEIVTWNDWGEARSR